MKFPASTMNTDFGQEVVLYALIERPFVSIQGDTNVTYRLAATLRSNFAFFPRIQDAFLRSLQLKSSFFNGLMT